MLARMLVLGLALAAMSTIAVPASAWQSQPRLKERDVKRVLDEYLADGTSAEQRGLILKGLRTADVAHVQRYLRTSLKDEAKRERSLEVAVALKVPDLYKAVSPYLDGPHEAVVTRLFLTTNDSEGLRVLFERFQSLDMESDSFNTLESELTQTRLPADSLAPLVKCISSGTRVEAALRILAWQVAIPDLSAEDVKRRWKLIAKDHERDLRDWPVQGVNLLLSEGWEMQNVVKKGPNLLVEPGGYLTLKELPAVINRRRVSFRVRLAVLEGTDAQYSFLNAENMGYRPTARDGHWVSLRADGSTSEKVAYTQGEWQEHTWEISPGAQGQRKVVVSVGGKPIYGNGPIPLDMVSLVFYAKEARLLIGALDVVTPD